MRENDRRGKKFGSRSFDNRQERSFGGNRFGSGRSFDGPREMHKAVCASCNTECEVPFKPTEGRPVYCRACFAQHAPKRF